MKIIIKNICICPRCASVVSVTYRSNYQYRCPKCNQLLYNTKMSPEEWDKIPKEEKQTLKDKLIAQAEKDAASKTQEAAEEAAKETERILLRKKQKETFLMTTGFSFETHKIVSYLGIKSGEVVLGTGFLSEFSASLNDIFGSESNTLSTKLAQAKNSAMDKLISHCIDAGANAVIGVDLDISTLGPNMIVACANGTAVKVEPLDEI